LKNENSNRRGFIRKLAKLGATGGIAAVASAIKIPQAEAVTSFPDSVTVDDNLDVDYAGSNWGSFAHLLRFGGSTGEGIGSKRDSGGDQYGLDFYTNSTPRMSITNSGNVGIGTTTPLAALEVHGAPTSGVGVSGDAYTGVEGTGQTGVIGVTTSSDGVGVLGEAITLYSSAIGVKGLAGQASAKPIVAQGASGQTANLQEWQKSDGTALSVVDKDGKLGVGTTTPQAAVHGFSNSGYGVLGKTTSTTGKAGVYGYGSGSATGVRGGSASGFALYVDGKNYFKSAQRGTIPSGVSQFDVTVLSGIRIRTAAMIFVTLMSSPGGVSVKWVQRLSDTQFRIYLTGATGSSIAFGYFIVN